MRNNNKKVFLKMLFLRTIAVLLFIITFLFGNITPNREYSTSEWGSYGDIIGIYTGEISPSEFCERNVYPEYVEKYLEKYNPTDRPLQKYFFVITRIMSVRNIYQISSDMKFFSDTDKTVNLHIKYIVDSTGAVVPEETSYYLIRRINGKYNNQEVNIFIEQQNKMFKLKDNYLYEKTGNELAIIKYLGDEEEVTIPDIVNGYKVTGIGYDAFHSKNIKKINLSKYIKRIESSAIYCTSLTGIYVDDNNKYFSDIDGILFSKNYNSLIKYPAGLKGETYTIPDSVEIITYDSFYKSEFLKQITFPKDIISMPNCSCIIDYNDKEYLKLIVYANSEAEKFAKENGYLRNKIK